MLRSDERYLFRLGAKTDEVEAYFFRIHSEKLGYDLARVLQEIVASSRTVVDRSLFAAVEFIQTAVFLNKRDEM